MIVTHKIPYRNGELRIGWASWDDGSMTARSIKYAYQDQSGKVSRGAPELPFDILIDMLMLAAEQGELSFESAREPVALRTASREQLREESRVLKSALLVLQKLIADLPWADFKGVYDQVGERYERIKSALEKRAA